ncbi:unnamed protein product [Prorocentrum cordatum]|uniref:Uncharacterized protein n=1 Tax=Prorocentrum cordatum TaxID=2364126 RepID=A0ABN9RYF9_9DINO|nr:unnamed protein product [Polarella glacialis]
MIYAIGIFFRFLTRLDGLSAAVRQRLRRSDVLLQWADQGIDALNCLYGHAGSPPSAPANLGQQTSLNFLEDCYLGMGAMPSEPGFCEEALRELLSGSTVYSEDGGARVPYSKELVSWPEVGSSPVDLVGCLTQDDADWARDWRHNLLKTPDEALLGHMIGVFVARKKSGKLRIVFDTRYADAYFHPAPATRLPTAAAVSSVESGGLPLCVAAGDLDNAFYRLRPMPGLEDYFALPPLSSSLAGIAELEGFIEVPKEFFDGAGSQGLADALLPPSLAALVRGPPWLTGRHLQEPGSMAGASASRRQADRHRRAAAARQVASERGPSGGLSVLERAAVRPGTERLYQVYLRAFLQFCLVMAIDWTSEAEMDVALVTYLNSMYFEGRAPNEGSALLASLAHYTPALYKRTAQALPRATRCLAGWRRRVPTRMRLPLPRRAAFAIAGTLAAWGHPRMGLFVMLSFAAYLRPQEAIRLAGRHLVPPVAHLGQAPTPWGLLLHDSDLQLPGKTNLWDESVLLDQAPWLEPALEALRTVAGDGPLWDFLPTSIARLFEDACHALGLMHLQPHLYSLRHGGASEDLLSGARTPEQVMRRGRWATVASLRRYGKETRLLREAAKVDPDVLLFGEIVERNFLDVLRGGPLLPPAWAELPASVGRAGASKWRSCLFLELFAGQGRISQRIRDLGYGCLDLDLVHGACEDHLRTTFESVVRGWLLSKASVGLWLGTPCTSWSQALRDPLRSSRFPMGKPGLSGPRLDRLRVGNRSFHLSCRLIRLCIQIGCPVFLENPRGSLLWHAPEMVKLLSDSSCAIHKMDMCRFGTPFKKPTTVACWNAGVFPSLCKSCSGKGGICSSTGLPHLILQGRDKGAPARRTELAAAYSPQFARSAALAMTHSANDWLAMSCEDLVAQLRGDLEIFGKMVKDPEIEIGGSRQVVVEYETPDVAAQTVQAMNNEGLFQMKLKHAAGRRPEDPPVDARGQEQS